MLRGEEGGGENRLSKYKSILLIRTKTNELIACPFRFFQNQKKTFNFHFITEIVSLIENLLGKRNLLCNFGDFLSFFGDCLRIKQLGGDFASSFHLVKLDWRDLINSIKIRFTSTIA